MSEALREQLHMIRESAADFSAAYGGPPRARQISKNGAAWEPGGWKAMAELGWMGILVPETAGGLSLGPSAMCVVLEECGRALLMQPLTAGLVSASVLAEAMTNSSGAPEVADMAAKALTALLTGDGHIVYAEADGGSNTGGGELNLSLVPDGNTAAQCLVARGKGADFELRLLRADVPGLDVSTRSAVDGSGLADMVVKQAAWAEAPRLLHGTQGQLAWLRGRGLAWLGDAAYLCGLAEAALRLALDYMRVRCQFGAPIGSFQALQHRAADCHVDVISSHALVHEAARAWDTPLAAWAAAAAVHRAAETTLRVTKEAVQFHGAIGFADEHDAGLYLRRAMTVGARHTTAALAQLRQDEQRRQASENGK